MLVVKESTSNGLRVLRAINALLSTVTGKMRRERLFPEQAVTFKPGTALQEFLWAVDHAGQLLANQSAGRNNWGRSGENLLTDQIS